MGQILLASRLDTIILDFEAINKDMKNSANFFVPIDPANVKPRSFFSRSRLIGPDLPYFVVGIHRDMSNHDTEYGPKTI